VTEKKRAIRVLIADDEAEVRNAYRDILTETDMSGETAVFRNLRERLFTKPAADQVLAEHDVRAGVLRRRRSGRRRGTRRRRGG